MSERLQTVTRLFLDTAPIVHYVEVDQRYLSRVDPVFDRLDAGALAAVTSPVTLAECLVVPYRQDRDILKQAFVDLLLHGNNLSLVEIDEVIGEKAAEFRARYILTLTDAFQIAVRECRL